MAATACITPATDVHKHQATISSLQDSLKETHARLESVKASFTVRMNEEVANIYEKESVQPFKCTVRHLNCFGCGPGDKKDYLFPKDWESLTLPDRCRMIGQSSQLNAIHEDVEYICFGRKLAEHQLVYMWDDKPSYRDFKTHLVLGIVFDNSAKVKKYSVHTPGSVSRHIIGVSKKTESPYVTDNIAVMCATAPTGNAHNNLIDLVPFHFFWDQADEATRKLVLDVIKSDTSKISSELDYYFDQLTN